MPRPATGTVVERKTRSKITSYSLRFRANGRRQFIHLGYSPSWTRRRAEEELANVIADVRRGTWQPPSAVSAPKEAPTFHEFSSQWFADQKLEGGRRGKGLTAAGVADLRWRLEIHLLPFFAGKRLDEITVQDVDAYRRAKVREARIGTTSINKTLETLGAILEVAVEYEIIGRNVAKGKRRRLPAQKPQRSYLDRADHVAALLQGARRLDDKHRGVPGQKRALVATLVFSGPRIGEALSLRWRDVDLARGEIKIRASKTDAGVRAVNVLPALRDELTAYKARLGHVADDGLVFGTSPGARQSPSNVRQRILAKAVEEANRLLADEGLESLPEGLTPHSLRRTFASILFAIGETPPYVMAQMGHTTPALTLRIYARQMDRRDGESERLKALVEGFGWAPMGTYRARAQGVVDTQTADT